VRRTSRSNSPRKVHRLKRKCWRAGWGNQIADCRLQIADLIADFGLEISQSKLCSLHSAIS
jgi:hypothetical protein